MPRKAHNETIRCRFFRWVLFQRNQIWCADGRANHPSLGRPSLRTRNRAEAVTALQRLDLFMAVETGRADRSALSINTDQLLSLDEGRRLYFAHVSRPEVAGGAGATTQKRYSAVLHKFIEFAKLRGVQVWNRVTATVVTDYLRYLEQRKYRPRTLYIEATTIQQCMRYLTEAGHLPIACLFKLRMRRPTGSNTYCWRSEELKVMVEHCRSRPDLNWLADVILALTCTGIRISELANLRWSDNEYATNMIRIRNDSSRRTKNRRDRSVPIYADLWSVLQRLPRLPDGRVFHGPRGAKIKPDTVRVIFVREVIEPLKKRFPTTPGETGFEHGRLHSFRHYFCAQCATRAVPILVLQRWLGHRDSAMVNYYFSLSDEESQRQMKRMDFAGDSAGEVAGG